MKNKYVRPKRCKFVKLSKNPLKPLKKAKPKKNVAAINNAKIMKEWRDGWFKGEFELNNDTN
tara:strand:+ start:720 stop:905 length:186 start_codon:yes stop_codon:yes gene_type:complete